MTPPWKQECARCQNAALEAAAGADGAEEDHINAKHDGEGEQGVCAALQDDVLFLDSAFQFH